MLLAWYDAHARDLPWRSPPGTPAPDPYRVWLSEVMLQQTTVAAVRPYFTEFVARWPTVGALALAPAQDILSAWAGLGYYARARNMIACARHIASTGFPTTETELRELPGIGRYTAAAIAAIAFDAHAVVVDGNVERVVARLFAVETPLPAARQALYALTATITPPRRCGDFSQAMMDLGATVCTPRAPDCPRCPLRGNCRGSETGTPAAFPRRAPRVAKPERRATAWWVVEADRVLLVRRPPSGLLGSMLALPSTLEFPPSPAREGPGKAPEKGVMSDERPASSPAQSPSPQPSPWREEGDGRLGCVTHVFTHFRLTLDVVAARIDPGCVLPPDAQWWPLETLDEAGLPTLFVKAALVASQRE